MEGRGVLIMASISLQDLKRRLYSKAKADKDWRFWGPVRSCGQTGDATRRVRPCEAQQRGAGYRRRHVRGDRGGRCRGVSGATAGRTGHTHLSAAAEPE